MYKLTIQPEAINDIKAMIAAGGTSRSAAVKIVAFLEELQSNQAWINELLTRKFANDEFNVDKFVTYWDAGLDIWRLSVYEFDFRSHKKYVLPFRILYGYDQSYLTFRVLGILPRNFNYEPEHELTKRICRTYDDLGMPKHRVTVARPSGNKSS